VFDLDDTLLDERPGRVAGRAALEEALRDSLPELPEADFADAYDRARLAFWRDATRHRRGRLDLVAARTEIVGEALRETGFEGDAQAREASRCYFAAATEAQCLMPGALDVLSGARARYDRLVLLTNGAEGAQTDKIRRFGLSRWFDHIQIEGAFGLGKPQPEAFRHAVEAVGASRGEALMVGNDYEHDVMGALGAGLDAVWIDLEGRGVPREPPDGLCGTIQDIRQLPDLFERYE
jgi:putative hydrolase of the HAD superfamily